MAYKHRKLCQKISLWHHHHHTHQGLGHLARSVSTVTAAFSLVSRLFSFLVDCSGMILKGFGCVAFFAGVKASSSSRMYQVIRLCDACVCSVNPLNALHVLSANRSSSFWHSEDRSSWYIFIIKPKRCNNSQIYFWNITLHVSDRFPVHHQESSTVHYSIRYMSCRLRWLLASRIRIPLASSQRNLYDMYLLLCVQC